MQDSTNQTPETPPKIRKPVKNRYQLIKRLFGFPLDVGLKFCLQDQFFKKVLRINSKVPWPVHFTSTIGDPANIHRGAGVYPGDSPGVYINAKNGIFIGDYTNLGPNVGLISANHDPVNNTIHVPADPIRLGRYCWVGMGAVILPAVELGDFSIVGAGAVVTRSFTDGYCVLAGNPASVIKKLDREACDQFAMNR